MLASGLELTASSWEMEVDMNPFPVMVGAPVPRGEALSGAQLGEGLRNEVRVDVLSRGNEAYQADVVIRGGIFEGSGINLGALSLWDPQTGHYYAELPLDPGFLESGELRLGGANAFHGFNATAGTLEYNWRGFRPETRTDISVGNHNLFGGSIRTVQEIGDGLYGGLSVSAREGDGTVVYGDFSMERYSGYLGGDLWQGSWRLFGGYMDKAYGWPGMYTGFSSFPETEDYETTLTGFQIDGNGWRVGGYYRRFVDDYDFDRHNETAPFQHETEVWSVQGDGAYRLGSVLWNYRWILLKDDLVSSTSLTEGNYDSREYAKVGIHPEWQAIERGAATGIFYGGAYLDTTSEDSTRGYMSGGFRWQGFGSESLTAYAEYNESTQVPTYTALKSSPNGLFGGNPDLGREFAETMEAGLAWHRQDLRWQIAVFHREDQGLIDWVFEEESVNARQANQVDMDVIGVESRLSLEWESLEATISYAYLDKDADYSEESVDASFYALNYARNRLMLLLAWELPEIAVLSTNLEYREQIPNILRDGSTDAFRADAEIRFELPWRDEIYLTVFGRNLTKSRFQDYPGTMAPGRQLGAVLSHNW